MNIEACEGCGKSFLAPFAPCPDEIKGCLMAHYNNASWICPHCSHNNGPSVRKAIIEGPHTMEIGVGVGNIQSIRRLELEK